MKPCKIVSYSLTVKILAISSLLRIGTMPCIPHTGHQSTGYQTLRGCKHKKSCQHRTGRATAHHSVAWVLDEYFKARGGEVLGTINQSLSRIKITLHGMRPAISDFLSISPSMREDKLFPCKKDAQVSVPFPEIKKASALVKSVLQ